MSYDTMTRKINLIVVHKAQTPTGKYFDVDDIEQWHKERGEWVLLVLHTSTLGITGLYY